MGNRRTTEETVPVAELPEALRSALIGSVVANALQRYASDVRGDEDQSIAVPHAAILSAAADEITAWHARPASNGSTP